MHHQYLFLTGATGSIGRAFLAYRMQQNPETPLLALSRDEQKILDLQQRYPRKRYPHLYFELGDIRDAGRIRQLLAQYPCHEIVHAAALKHVPLAEHYPGEYIQTNIIGTQNLLEAAVQNAVQRITFISTDKAFLAAGVYAATKRCAEQLLIAHARRSAMPAVGILRPGNLVHARGSVFEQFNKSGHALTITHPEASRFFLSEAQLLQAIDYVRERTIEGEIVIPKMQAVRIADLGSWLKPGVPQQVAGLRPGEKIHELLFDESLHGRIAENRRYYILFPEAPSIEALQRHDAQLLETPKACSSADHLLPSLQAFNDYLGQPCQIKQ
ncbi:MAG: UDP-N-acetylglucosamine 4,6-dehydratase (inverting) [Thermonema sp.]|uniref:polysaccharide biosynthesis protein n=1 Tax=Thermonema sp. TaxID=2231181 RepID=UPI0021DF078A|nr:polysaccharide biosynthesis protein [Thermonema sp.]GIV39999.1 MAG: UDP-N-acetylglucosamine 4,6-dehydratase (inverting) [Thermonema sp.]